MKGILALRNPAGEFFEGVIEIPSDKTFYEKQLKRDGRGSPLMVEVADFPDQLRCVVRKKLLDRKIRRLDSLLRKTIV